MKETGKETAGLMKRGVVGNLEFSAEYRSWLKELRKRYRRTQVRAAVAVNSSLLDFYWELGRDISEKYPGRKRGLKFFDNLSHDLIAGIKDPRGLSPNNLRYAQHFYELYSYLLRRVGDNSEEAYLLQVIGDKRLQVTIGHLMMIPWGHHQSLINKCKGDADKALFYVRRILDNHWNRDELDDYLDAGLYEKSGKAITNFSATLPEPQGRLATELIKSEYTFGLLDAVDSKDEREVERALVKNITATLTELGGGFAYVGHQVCVNVGGEEFWPDLIFYHLKTRRYLVIELKTGNFKPEHIGQLGFYMVAVDEQIKNEWDGPTVGLVLCKKSNRTVAEYALRMSSMPMGIGSYRLYKTPPKSQPELTEMQPTLAKLGPVVDETLAEYANTVSSQKPVAKKQRGQKGNVK